MMDHHAFLLAAAGLLLAGCSDNELHKLDGSGLDRPSIVANPGHVDFGEVPFSETRTESVTLTNEGSQSLVLRDIQIEGPTSYTFTWPDPVDRLGPGEETDLLVSYAPLSASEDGRILVSSNDPVTPALPVPLSGSAAYGALVITPNPVEFGGVEVGDFTTEVATLANLGGDDLTVSTLGVLGEAFTLVDGPAPPFALGPGDEVALTLRFDGITEGVFEGTIYAESDTPVPQTTAELVGSSGVGDITGRICGPDGDGDSWVVGARVWVAGQFGGGDEFMVEDFTDDEGFFLLEQVPAGEWTVTVEKGSWSTTFDVTCGGGTTELAEPECLDPDSAHVAVVTGEYDHVAGILNGMGVDYDVYTGTNNTYLELLRDPELMSTYDIIFFNCGMSFSWLSYESEVVANLQAYVADGGSVYASDWAFGLVEASWPDILDLYGTDRVWDPSNWDGSGDLAPYVGYVLNVTADVIDTIMQGALGSATASITFDLDAWVVVEEAGSQGAPLLRGDVMVYNDDFSDTFAVPDVPLAVRGQPGGTVIYTSFHNEQQATSDMIKALEEIILSL